MKYPVPQKRRLETVRIVGIYALFGLAWIYGSDTVLGWLFEDRATLMRIAVIKGFLFIICTATLLYFLIGRFLEQLAAADGERTESLKNYRTIFNTTSEAIFVHDIHSGRIVDVNDRMLEMYGYRRDEALSAEIGELSEGTPPYSQQEAARKVLQAAAEGPQVFEWLCRRKSRELFWAEVSLRKITIEGSERIIAVVRDVSERKEHEGALSANERFLRMLTDQLPGMVCYWTGELTCSFANKACREWFNKSPEEIIGMSMRELLGEGLFAKNEPYARRALSGEPQHFQGTLEKPGGETAFVWAHYIPDLVDGATRGFYVLISDVSELKRAEEEKVRLESQLQQAQKMESVGRLAGGVAHDFNNLLTVIIGFAQLGMKELGPGHPTLPRLEGIRQAAEKSAALTRQLLGFARKQTIAPKVLDLNGSVEEMLKMLKRLVGEDIDVAWQPAAGLWRVKIDPSQIDQILANLCVNARDAIADVGKITIETRNALFDETYCSANFGFLPGEYVVLAVSDDGCGMDKETLGHIFEPFFTTKGMGQGTGLGLATVYGIVKQNSGFINTYSEPGQGTTFKICLPRHTGEVAEPRIERPVKPASRGQETILLIEDEPSIREVTVALLALQGYQVLPAGLPSEALELARRHADRIDLVVTDVVMPEMNGRDLVRKILPLCPKVKCLFMSGYTANVIAHHGVLDEGVHFISKPFSLADLSAKVRAVLDAGGRG